MINFFPDRTVANMRITEGHHIITDITTWWAYKKNTAVKTLANRTKTLFITGQTGKITAAFVRII
jgi:hypothetical protein